MPIYAYRCEACGFAKDVLQKVSDPRLTECPSCGKSSFKKQITAAGFQLKGTGWYATDFRGGSSTKAPSDMPPAESSEKSAEKPTEKSAEKPAEKSSNGATTPAPVVAPTAAPAKSGSGGGTPSTT